MSIDTLFYLAGWIVPIILLILFIPRDKIREAMLVFLFKLLLNWFLGLVVVQLGLIEYPVRLFPRATNTNFSFEYFIYPSICAIFNLNYPNKKNGFIQFLYYSFYCSSMTVIEVIAERYSNVIRYIHWTWHITWITLFLTFFLSRCFYVWFFRLKADQSILVPKLDRKWGD